MLADTVLRVLRPRGLSIFQQLLLEEALFRGLAGPKLRGNSNADVAGAGSSGPTATARPGHVGWVILNSLSQNVQCRARPHTPLDTFSTLLHDTPSGSVQANEASSSNQCAQTISLDGASGWGPEGRSNGDLAIILGLSGRPADVVNVAAAWRRGVSLIRRFSGGGTVVIYPGVLSVSFILPCSLFAAASSPGPGTVASPTNSAGLKVFPSTLHRWTTAVYNRVFHPGSSSRNGLCRLADASMQPPVSSLTGLNCQAPSADCSVPMMTGSKFALRENDYVVYRRAGVRVNPHRVECTSSHTHASAEGEVETRKFGGNAQAINRRYACHHTSFIWSSDSDIMNELLLMPKKQPRYRQQRSHGDFVCGISSEECFRDLFSSPDDFLDSISDALKTESIASQTAASETQDAPFSVEFVDWDAIDADVATLIAQFRSDPTVLRSTYKVDGDGRRLEDFSH